MGADRISHMAGEVLAHCLDALGASEKDVPDRAYVVMGAAPVECCDQLTVGFAALRPKLVGRGDPNVRGRFVAVPLCQLAIELWRTWPVENETGGPIPSTDQLGDASVSLIDDAWIIWTWLTRLWAENRLFVDEEAALTPGSTPVQWESLTPLGPQGARAGWRMLITVDVPAVREAVGA